jgi:hypothetical protein
MGKPMISSDNTDESYLAGARIMEKRGLQFAGETARKRYDVRTNGKTEPPPPLSANAARIAMQIEEIQQSRDAAIAERDQALARIEQFESNETRLMSELEGERARTAAAKAEAEAARIARAQLETVLIAIRNHANDALPE